MSSENFTDDDIAKLLLTEKNNLEDDMWSDDEGSEDKDKEMIESEHEDNSDCEGEEEKREGDSNGRDDGDVTSSGGSGIIIRMVYE
jgi:hypothetical protein